MGDNTVPLVLFPPLFLSILTKFFSEGAFLNLYSGGLGLSRLAGRRPPQFSIYHSWVCATGPACIIGKLGRKEFYNIHIRPTSHYYKW
jgi:hypothetical protein